MTKWRQLEGNPCAVSNGKHIFHCQDVSEAATLLEVLQGKDEHNTILTERLLQLEEQLSEATKGEGE